MRVVFIIIITDSWPYHAYRLQYKIWHQSRSADLPSPNQLTSPAFDLVQKWKVDTGKCVDASPLLIQDDSRDPSETVYIGSHSGRFFAICFRTGRVLWESQLTDRIESSACLSVCGQYVIVGESVTLISCPIQVHCTIHCTCNTFVYTHTLCILNFYTMVLIQLNTNMYV